MELEEAIAEVVGRNHVLTDADMTAGYERDWTGRYGGRARCVVRPGDANEVARVIELCRENGVAVIPQGGNTGLVGGSVPRLATGRAGSGPRSAIGRAGSGPRSAIGRPTHIVLSLRRLNTVGEIDAALGQVTVGAGMTLAELQAAARKSGEDAGLDFAARDSCTIGGVVACDAGGSRALRHGTARAHVAGLEAVMADGSIIQRLSGLTKDNAGYDLPALLIGSEGTLGIITKVRWKLTPLLPARAAALVPLQSISEAAELLTALRKTAPSLESCDFFFDAGMELVLAHQRRAPPLPSAPIYVLAECAAREDPTDELADALTQAGISDAVIADDTPGREALWAIREGHSDAINAAGIPHKLDVGVPLAELGGFVEDVQRAVGVNQLILFGHLGDGNVHVNILGPEPDDTRVDDQVLELVLAHGGTISAEHGIGVAKAAWLERAVGSASYGAMRRIKRALDPENVLNPGVMLTNE